MPDDDRTAGAKARHQRDLSRARNAVLRSGRPDTREAGPDQSPVQRDQIQQGRMERSSSNASRAARNASVSVSRTTGGGLSPEQLAQLFQPFNRLGQEAGVEEGTGIGLVVCKRLVELMGGVIGVESVVGKGSVFWIDLNLTTEPRADRDAVESIDSARTPRCKRARNPHAALRRGQPGESDAGRGSDRAPPRYPPAECEGRQSRHRDCARLPARCHPDGHQPAGHQRHHGAEDPGSRTRQRRTSRWSH